MPRTGSRALTRSFAGKQPRKWPSKLERKKFEGAIEKLHVELVKLQLWVRRKGLKVAIIFEGRDAAGKGGIIKRITERVSPRIFRVIALPAPTEREKSQMYIQRYISHLPAAGEMVIFDRSWYNRALVERVMGFCTEEQAKYLLQMCPEPENRLVGPGTGKRRRARNCVAHFLSLIPYQEVRRTPVKLPKRQRSKGYKEPRL